MDAGNFTLVIGPNLGAPVAGRWLGRFADICGRRGVTPTTPGCNKPSLAGDQGAVPAEVVYLPSTTRSTNVIVRPTLGHYEIVVSGRGSAEHQLELSDLLVGYDGGGCTCAHAARESSSVRQPGTCSTTTEPRRCANSWTPLGRASAAEFTAFDWGAG